MTDDVTAGAPSVAKEGSVGAPVTPAAGRSLRVVQRVVFPGADLDVVPLYVETNPDRGAAELHAEQVAGARGHGDKVPPPPSGISAATGATQSVIRFGVGVPAHPAEEILPRRSAAIKAGGRVSFGTYFNAFPASYWRRWTTVDSVTLRLRVAGDCAIILYRSAAKGHSFPIETIAVDTDEPVSVERTLPLAPFIDGGWYWFDIVAGPQGTTVIKAEWAVPAEPGPPGRISLGFTTFNRADFMLEHLRTLGSTPEVLELIDAVYVADQGTKRVADHPDFADSAKGLGDKLRIIEQGNIGGSGGFSRSMDETVRAGNSDYLLILDDDITLEPESILRAATFADLARKPTIVGGHMFSLYDRSVLHAFAEHISPVKWWWDSSPNTRARHDFGRRNLRNTPWLHRRAEAEYNGWWMCLIPTKIIKEVGLAIPLFIKWDDAEYAVRAGKKGYPRCPCRGWPRGTFPGWTRTTRWTGRRITTSVTGSSWRCCIRRSSTAAGSPRKAPSDSCRHCCRCSTPRRRCGCWRSRTCCPGRSTCTATSARRWPRCVSCASSSPTRAHWPTWRTSRPRGARRRTT